VVEPPPPPPPQAANTAITARPIRLRCFIIFLFTTPLRKPPARIPGGWFQRPLPYNGFVVPNAFEP
jgi:hypothetical protein